MLRFGYKSTNLPDLSTRTKHMYKEKGSLRAETNTPRYHTSLWRTAYRQMSDQRQYFSETPSGCFLTLLKFYYQEKKEPKKPHQRYIWWYAQSALPSYRSLRSKALSVFSGAKSVHKDGTGNKAILVITTWPFWDFEALLQQHRHSCTDSEKNGPVSTTVWCKLLQQRTKENL